MSGGSANRSGVVDRRAITRAAAYCFVLAGSLGTAAALIGPWTWRQGEAHGKPAATVLLAVALLAPALSGLRFAVSRLDASPVRPEVSAGIAGAAAASASLVSPQWTRRFGGPGHPPRVAR